MKAFQLLAVLAVYLCKTRALGLPSWRGHSFSLETAIQQQTTRGSKFVEAAEVVRLTPLSVCDTSVGEGKRQISHIKAGLSSTIRLLERLKLQLRLAIVACNAASKGLVECGKAYNQTLVVESYLVDLLEAKQQWEGLERGIQNIVVDSPHGYPEDITTSFGLVELQTIGAGAVPGLKARHLKEGKAPGPVLMNELHHPSQFTSPSECEVPLQPLLNSVRASSPLTDDQVAQVAGVLTASSQSQQVASQLLRAAELLQAVANRAHPTQGVDGRH